MIYISLKVKAPLAISSGRFVGNEDKSLNYIPGSAFRGAVAAKLLKDWGEDDPVFRDVFIKGEGRFPNLYPYKKAKFSLPFPRSAMTCKYKSGFKSDDGHNVIDILISSMDGHPIEECLSCGAQLEPIGGFYEERRDEYWSVQGKKRWITRTAIDESSQTAREEFLYTIEVIEEEQLFSGVLDIKDASLEDGQIVKSKKTLLKEGDILRMGMGKTRGFGEVEVESIDKIEDVLPPELIPGKEVDSRFNNFNKNLPFKGKGFSITLCSDAIILDDFLRYKTVIDEDALVSEFDLERNKIELKRAFTQTRLVPGWNQALGLPKEDEMAIEKGSVFFFKCDEDYDPVPLLKEMETKGIGERKEEGFGRIIICHPFHLNAKGGL